MLVSARPSRGSELDLSDDQLKDSVYIGSNLFRGLLMGLCIPYYEVGLQYLAVK